jgi:plastocyanin
VVDNAREAAEPNDSLLPKGGRAFSSGNIMPGATYRHTFTLPGRYRYFCSSHELDGMVGEIIVNPRLGDAAPVMSRENSHS